jgi:phosphoribosylglycinamide formyltransferase-1
MNSPPNIVIFASGQGSNFQALVEASKKGVLRANIVGLVTNRAGIPVLEKAKQLGVPCEVLDPKKFASRAAWDAAVVKTLQGWKADWVVLAGFLALVGPKVIQAFPERIVNVHPALLPKFGGPGMYGLKVHQAVMAARASESGITVHLVDLEYDRGRIVAQVKTSTSGIPNAEALADRIRELEHEHYPRVLNDLVWGRLTKT